MSNLCKYWLWYIFRLLTFQTKNKFQIFKLLTESLWNKEQNKKKREKNDENNCLIGFHRGQFLDSKAKTRGIALNILKVLWELLHCWYTPYNLKKKNPVIFVKKEKEKLVKVV